MWRYSSIATAIPKSSKKFIKFPIPRYLRNKNEVRVREIMSPRLEFAKRLEKVNRNAKKAIRKNMGIIPKVPGSMK